MKTAFMVLGLFAGVMALAITSGCMSTSPGSSSLASVVVENASTLDVQEATLHVFTADNYSVESSDEGRIVFVREASRRDQVQYGSYGESLQMRVEVTLELFASSNILVRADAYAVRGGSLRGGTKLLRMARRPYVKLLEKVRNLATKSPNPNETKPGSNG